MPNFIMNIRRVTKPGQEGTLIDSAVETLKGSNVQGNVSVEISGPAIGDPAVINALLFDNLSDVEKLHDAFLSNPERSAQFYATNGLASKVTSTLFRIIDPIELGPDDQPGPGKYLNRTLLVAKRGEASNLLSTLQEIRSNIPGRKPMINMAVAGNPDVVRIVTPYRSLEELQIAQEQRRESDEAQSAFGQIAGLTTMIRQTLARGVYNTMA
ncbi:MAG: hypothetical protein VB824_01520 [Dehalococcoidia bacterium]